MPRISEQRRQQLRGQILDAARDTFACNGFHETSMDDIIAAAGMSAGGVYRYFPSKAAIITAIAADVIRAVTSGLDAMPDQGSGAAPPLHQALGEVLRAVDAIADTTGRLTLQVWAEAQRDPEIAALVKGEAEKLQSAVIAVVSQATAAGELSAPTDPEALGRLLYTLVPGYLVKRRLLDDVDLEGDIKALAVLLPPPVTPPATTAWRSGCIDCAPPCTAAAASASSPATPT